MDRLLFLVAWTLTRLLQALPLPLAARLGRAGGQLGWWIDARHRRVALANIALAFPDLPPDQVRAIARENFRRIGESAASAIKTASMSSAQLRPRLEAVGTDKINPVPGAPPATSRVVAIGHFGNFEMYARITDSIPAYQAATTYRGIPHPLVDRLRQSLRERSGCRFYERRRQAAELKSAMATECLLLGLLADQHAGDRGLRLPFLGRECSTSASPAIFALRYHCPLHTAICYRTGLARWRIEFGNEIPVRHPDGRPRAVAEIMGDVNAAFESAVRRDPANWFWVHRRWKPGPAPSPASHSQPDAPTAAPAP
jgi:lauroyl/myristoyl acyltransferase